MRTANVEKQKLGNEIEVLKARLASLRKKEIDIHLADHFMNKDKELKRLLGEAHQKNKELQEQVDSIHNALSMHKHSFYSLQKQADKAEETNKKLLESTYQAILFQESRHNQESLALQQQVREKNNTLYWYKRTLGIRLRTIRSMLEQRAPKLSESTIIKEIETLIKDCGLDLTTEQIELDQFELEKEVDKLKQDLTKAGNVIRHLIEGSQIPRQIRTNLLPLPIKVNLDKMRPIPLEISQILSPQLAIKDMVNR